MWVPHILASQVDLEGRVVLKYTNTEGRATTIAVATTALERRIATRTTILIGE